MKNLIIIFILSLLFVDITSAQRNPALTSLNTGDTKLIMQSTSLDSAGTYTKVTPVSSADAGYLEVDCILTAQSDTASRDVYVYTALVNESDAYTVADTLQLRESTGFIDKYVVSSFVPSYVKLVVKANTAISQQNSVRCIATLKR